MVAKVEYADNQGTGDVDANETVVVGWQTLTWTFTNIAPGNVYNRFSILPNLGVSDVPAQDYFFDNITLVGGGGNGGGGNGGGGGAGELADNGGFEEAGTLESTGWTVFPNNGSITVVGDAFTGSSAARLVAAQGQNPLIKQQEKGAGTVMMGDTVDVSFRMKGSAITGGVVFVEFFSENTAGVNQTFLVQPPTFPTADWMLYQFSPTVDGDASRGVTLQIAAVCGDVPGCAVDITVDDISMSVAGGN